MGVPPKIALDGTISCETGYTFDAQSGLCVPDEGQISVTFDYPQTGQKFVIPNLPAATVDPKATGFAATLGAIKGGIIERAITATFNALLILFKPLILFFVSIADEYFSVITAALTAVQGENTLGFWNLCAAMLTDLFGIEVRGSDLFTQFQSRGRLAALAAFGGTMVNILASEFMGVTQAPSGSTFSVPPGAGIGGLPAMPMTPPQGVKAAAAFLGFATEFAVREGNIEGIASSLPAGLGEGVREMAVAFAKGLGLGRMGRIALKPLFNTMVAVPFQWAINQQYRPTLFSTVEALDAWHHQNFSDADLTEELTRHGYSDAKIIALKAIHAKPPTYQEMRVLLAAGVFQDADISEGMRREGYADADLAYKKRADDFFPARRVALAFAEAIAEQTMHGKITQDQYAAAMGVLPFLTPGEKDGLNQVVTPVHLVAASHLHPKHLSVGLAQKAYLEGILALSEFQAHVIALGYSFDDMQTITLETLVLAQKAAAAAAKKAAGTTTPTSTTGTLVP
jgi:hypothetical protein